MDLSKIKKGDTVILHMFTGIAVGVKEVLATDKKTVTLETRSGMATFSRKSGKQLEPEAKSERFANYITEDDGSFVPTRGKKAETEEKKPTKKGKAPAKDTKKTPAKKTTRKKKDPEPEEPFNEGEYTEEDED